MTLEHVKLICVSCPRGCTLDVTKDGDTIVTSNAGCKRGKDYAVQELTDPRRMVATTVKVQGGMHPLLPVYTASPFPKPRIQELLAALRQIEVKAPIRMEEVILENALDTGIDILASRNLT
ncbi:MAG: DUF1667 domain-containing protein [Anaerolineaceae bacterium]|nr:DUF1667 domain-containing protein [Anaerolineaceae bacterium]